MTLNRKIALCLGGVMAFSLLSGCGGQDTEEMDRLARIQEAGEIVVAMEGTWSPWTYHNDENELVGFDVEVAQAIAAELGVKATFVEGGWDGLLAGLESGRYDLMVNGVNVTEERAEVFDFSEPYAYDKMVVIVRADDDRIQTLADLNGMTTANTITSIYAEKAREQGATVTGVDDLAQTFQLLQSERIDATLNSYLTYLDYKERNPDSGLKAAVLMDEVDNIAIPMQKGEDTATLRAAVNDAIAKLWENGTLAELAAKYFGAESENLFVTE